MLDKLWSCCCCCCCCWPSKCWWNGGGGGGGGGYYYNGYCLIPRRILIIILSFVFVITVVERKSGMAVALSTSTPTTIGTIGARIQLATTADELFQVAADMWLPTDDNVPWHLQTQWIHHDKRQRWASQWLEKISSVMMMETMTLIEVEHPFLHRKEFHRAIFAVAIPFSQSKSEGSPTTTSFMVDRPDKEGRYLLQALLSIYVLLRRQSLMTTKQHVDDSSFFNSTVNEGIHLLLQRMIPMVHRLSLPQVITLRWIIKGLSPQFGNMALSDIHLTALDERVQRVPFDVYPCAIPWHDIYATSLVSSSSSSSSSSPTTLSSHGQNPKPIMIPPHTIVTWLCQQIPFQKEIIVTRMGNAVTERRGTAWVASEGIGALAYSGKLMTPHPLPTVVERVMRHVESYISSIPQTSFFDCALCNHYPAMEAACKFHTDPDHGTLWDRTTIVVSAGIDRIFAFKPISTT